MDEKRPFIPEGLESRARKEKSFILEFCGFFVALELSCFG